MEMNIAETLFLGSNEIDRMRKVIKDDVSLVLSLARDFLEKVGRTERTMPTPWGHWKVEIHEMTPKRSDPYFEMTLGYWRDEDHGRRSQRVYSSWFEVKNIAYEDVKVVYDSLPILLHSLAEMVPGLGRKWQPIVDAAVAATAR
jgi:hypothetical protein